jgi:hypothetical protein
VALTGQTRIAGEARNVSHSDFQREAWVDGPSAKRPWHPLTLLGIPALFWLLLATTCTPFVRATSSPYSWGSLSQQDQAAMWAANGTLMLEDVGPPPGARLGLRGNCASISAYDETQVTSVSTTFDLVTPDPEMGQGWDPHDYRRALDEIALRLRRLGFRHFDDGSLVDDYYRKFRKDGVEVLLTFAIPSNTSIVVQRDW